MRVLVRSLLLAVAAGVGVLVAGPDETARAATPKQIDNAIQRGMGYLRDRYKADKFEAGDSSHDAAGVGAAALAGLAMLEGGAAPNEPAIVNIVGHVRKNSYTLNHTYQVGLVIMFLDRLADPADVPIIQMLAVRLLAGQIRNGAWTYHLCGEIAPAVAQQLAAAFRAQPMGLAPGQNARELHPAVAAHLGALLRAPDRPDAGGDNSNTQFGLLALWIARRNGVPADEALARVEARFIAGQLADGSWGYMDSGGGSPSMICVGLMALATGLGRQQERKLTATAKEPPLKAAPPDKEKPPAKGDDLFFPAPKKEEPKKNTPERPVAAGGGIVEAKINLGFLALARSLALSMQAGGLVANGSLLGNRDLYFMWCLERVGVIFGKEKIGGIDWYEVGADTLVRMQTGDGSWATPGYPTHVNTSFAVLFLSKSNVVRDLSSKIGGDSGKGKTAGKDNKDPLEKATPPPAPEPESREPGGIPDNKAGRIATTLIGAPSAEWKKTLEAVREAKGSDYTYALALTIAHVEGDRRRDAREALAERLTRMTATNLRAQLKADDPEVRRAAALACGMKDDKAHVADLIERLGSDPEEYVARAALASLKSLTGQDHGPAAGATRDQRKAAADAWKAALSKRK